MDVTDTDPSGPRAGLDRTGRIRLAAWCLYDWASNAFNTLVITFIFAAYFTSAVAESPARGTALWGWTVGGAGILIALSAPLLGAAADEMGRRKPWLGLFTALTVISMAMLWLVRPEPDHVVLALVLVAVASICFELATVFYNAMLPSVAPYHMLGRASGWGWSAGYAGGLLCMILALVGFVQAEVPWFGVSTEDAGHVRATNLLAAAWYTLFSLPLFLLVSEGKSRGPDLIEGVRLGFHTLKRTILQVRRYSQIVRYLIARMLYTDGLNTLFAFGGIYAAGTFGMGFSEIVAFGIAMNVSAGLGALLFAWVDDWIGPKRTITISLLAIIGVGIGLLVVESVTWFWVLGLGLSAFLGPAQAASRSLMARLAPPSLRTEMFGLYAFSGKITAFAGPIVLGWATELTGSQRWGMATIILFLVAGLLILQKVQEPAP